MTTKMTGADRNGFAADNELINEAILYTEIADSTQGLTRAQASRLRHCVGEMARALRTEPDRVRAITADRDAERAMRKSYEEGIAWETSCLGCARLLTGLRAAEERAERAEAELRATRPAAELHWIRSGLGATSTCARCGEGRTAWCVGCGYCSTTCCACATPFDAEAPHG